MADQTEEVENTSIDTAKSGKKEKKKSMFGSLLRPKKKTPSTEIPSTDPTQQQSSSSIAMDQTKDLIKKSYSSIKKSLKINTNASTINEYIPVMLWKCVEYLESYGLQQSRLFKVSALKTEIDALYAQGSKVDFTNTIDVNAVAGVLKRFLKEHEPLLIPFDSFVVAAADTDEKQRLSRLISLIEVLPENHQATLYVLFDFLKYVQRYSYFNGMDAKLLASVFGPLVLRDDLHPMNMVKEKEPIVVVAEMLMFQKEKIFHKIFVSERFTQYMMQLLKRRPESYEDELTIPESTNELADFSWEEHQTEDGGIYYWNSVTNQTTWDKPDTFGQTKPESEESTEPLPPGWQEAYDEEQQATYYFSEHETSWERPTQPPAIQTQTQTQTQTQSNNLKGSSDEHKKPPTSPPHKVNTSVKVPEQTNTTASQSIKTPASPDTEKEKKEKVEKEKLEKEKKEKEKKEKEEREKKEKEEKERKQKEEQAKKDLVEKEKQAEKDKIERERKEKEEKEKQERDKIEKEERMKKEHEQAAKEQQRLEKLVKDRERKDKDEKEKQEREKKEKEERERKQKEEKEKQEREKKEKEERERKQKEEADRKQKEEKEKLEREKLEKEKLEKEKQQQQQQQTQAKTPSKRATMQLISFDDVVSVSPSKQEAIIVNNVNNDVEEEEELSMFCTSCQLAQPPGKFCEECGSILEKRQ